MEDARAGGRHAPPRATVGHQLGGRRAVGRGAGRPAPRQAAALDQLHAEVVLALVLADLVDRHDVRVIAACAAASASMRNRCDLGRRGELARQDHLERHRAVEADLPGPVDHAHAAAGDLPSSS